MLLNAMQRVVELAFAQLLDRAPDPVEQLRGQRLVLFDVLVDLDGAAHHLGNTFALHLVVLHLGKVVVERDHVRHDDLFVRRLHVHILGLQESRDAQLPLRNSECVVQIVCRIGLVQLLHIDQLRTVLVDERVEGEAVPPGGGEISHIHILVVGRLDLTPEKKGVLGRSLLLGLVQLLSGYEGAVSARCATLTTTAAAATANTNANATAIGVGASVCGKVAAAALLLLSKLARNDSASQVLLVDYLYLKAQYYCPYETEGQ